MARGSRIVALSFLSGNLGGGDVAGGEQRSGNPASFSRRGAVVAREAHNLQVVGSNPTGATKFYDIPLNSSGRAVGRKSQDRCASLRVDAARDFHLVPDGPGRSRRNGDQYKIHILRRATAQRSEWPRNTLVRQAESRDRGGARSVPGPITPIPLSEQRLSGKLARTLCESRIACTRNQSVFANAHFAGGMFPRRANANRRAA